MFTNGEIVMYKSDGAELEVVFCSLNPVVSGESIIIFTPEENTPPVSVDSNKIFKSDDVVSFNLDAVFFGCERLSYWELGVKAKPKAASIMLNPRIKPDDIVKRDLGMW